MNPIAVLLLRVVLGVAGLVFMISLLVAAVVVTLFLLLRALFTGRRLPIVTIWQRARSTVRPPPWSHRGPTQRKAAPDGDIIDVEPRETGGRREPPRLPPD